MHEYFDVVDKNDKVIGKALRSECHKNPKLIHRGVFVVVTNIKGEFLLQKRSMEKDLYPGVWDISVGGHNKPGDSYEETAKREMKEELGLVAPLKKVGKMFIRQKTETEFDMVFAAKSDIKKIKFNKREIDEVKFFTLDEMKKIGRENLGPKFWNVINFYLKSK